MLHTLLANISHTKYGAEIGGPSASNALYEHSNSMDNIVFSKNTIWKDHSDVFEYYPNKSGKVIINDAVNITNVKDTTYDFVFASHCLEHIANPLKAMCEWSRIVKPDGYIVLILPEKSECFDHRRHVSSFSQLLSQYNKNVGEDDLSTLPEILENHDLSLDTPAGNFEQFKSRSLDNFNNRCLHHYVYSPDLLREICAFLKFEFIYTETKGLDIWCIMKKPCDPKLDGMESVEYVINNSIPGCLVECGVNGGHFEDIWIKTLQSFRCVRDIYMFDTFAGMTEPGKYDYTRTDATIYKNTHEEVHDIWKSNAIDDTTNDWCYTSLRDVKFLLQKNGYPKENLHYVVGDVMQTLSDPRNVPDQIAILRLDTDWYESSKYELEMLYSKVSPGGVIVFDDYFHWDGQRRAVDDFFAVNGITPRIVPIGNQKTGYMIKV